MRRPTAYLLRTAASALFVISLTACEEGVDLSPATPSAPAAAAPTVPSQAGFILEKFLEASRQQQDSLRDSTMEVRIQGRFPKLKREAVVQGVRRIDPAGEISYSNLSSQGDGTIRKEVIAKYIEAETEASASLVRGNGKVQAIGINPDNYKFKYKGPAKLGDRQAYVFQLTPRQKRLGLFKGEIWIDADTYQTLREAGTLVKNPSIYLRKVEFVRDYALQSGIAVPSQIVTKIDTRVGIKAELEVSLSNFVNPLLAQSKLCPLGW